MNFQDAYSLSWKFKKFLEPACERLEVVGSVKRGDMKAHRDGVHDIEILLIPHQNVSLQPSLWESNSLTVSISLDSVLAQLIKDGVIRSAKRKAAEFCVHQDATIAGLTANNETFVKAYHEERIKGWCVGT